MLSCCIFESRLKIKCLVSCCRKELALVKHSKKSGQTFPEPGENCRLVFTFSHNVNIMYHVGTTVKTNLDINKPQHNEQAYLIVEWLTISSISILNVVPDSS